MKLQFRTFKNQDWDEVRRIYKYGIETENATYFLDTPNFKEWNLKYLNHSRIIAEIDDEIVGWTALMPFSNRAIFKGVAEVSVYVSEKYMGKKIGSELLKKQIEESEKNGIWTLQSTIFPENIASIKIHTNLGFRKVGYREKIGKMDKPDGEWRDFIILERRSKKIGVD